MSEQQPYDAWVTDISGKRTTVEQHMVLDPTGHPALTEDQMRDSQIALLNTGRIKDGKPVLRLLTYEQVRMMRDLWVLAAVDDGYTETVEVAYAIMNGYRHENETHLGAMNLFTCEPREGIVSDERITAILGEPVSQETGWVAQALGAALLRLEQRKYLTIKLR